MRTSLSKDNAMPQCPLTSTSSSSPPLPKKTSDDRLDSIIRQIETNNTCLDFLICQVETLLTLVTKSPPSPTTQEKNASATNTLLVLGQKGPGPSPPM
eukprot:14957230-Ditylum_brightwellii.AAC.1